MSQRIALLCLFALVYWGYWAIIDSGQYLRQDGVVSTATARRIEDHSRIDLQSPIQLYTSYPGLHVIAAITAIISGLDISTTGTILVISNILLYATVLYWVGSIRFKGDLFLPSLLPLVMLGGNPYLGNLAAFHATNYGLTMVTIMIALLYGGRRFQGYGGTLVWSLILMALTVGHLMSSFVAATILAAVAIVNSRSAGGTQFTRLAEVAVLLPLLWLSYLVVNYMRGLVFGFGWLGSGILKVLLFQWDRGITGGVPLPLWVSAIYLFWLFVLVIPMSLVIPRLRIWKRLGTLQRLEIAGLMGSTMLLLVALRGSFFVSAGVIRFLAYAPIFTIAVLLEWLSFRKLLWSVGLAVLVLSFPSFLAFNRNVAIYHFYDSDVRVGQFLRRVYGTGDGMLVYAAKDSGLVHDLYDAEVQGEGIEELMLNAKGFWRSLDTLEERFRETSGRRVFVYSSRFAVPYISILGVRPDDQHWEKFLRRLGRYHRSYDNGNAIVFL